MLATLHTLLVTMVVFWALPSHSKTCIEIFTHSRHAQLSEISMKGAKALPRKTFNLAEAPLGTYRFYAKRFNDIESQGPDFKELLQKEVRARPHLEFVKKSFPGQLASSEQIEAKRAAFKQIHDMILRIYLYRIQISGDLKERMALEAQARAIDLLSAQGVATRYVYDPFFNEGVVFLEKGQDHTHSMNVFAREVSRRYRGLQIGYSPYNNMDKFFAGQFSSNENSLLLPGNLILNPTLHNENLLHEFRHARNRINLVKGRLYSLYGYTVSSGEKLPGLTTLSYDQRVSHDEIHTYFRSLRDAILTYDVLVPNKSISQQNAFLQRFARYIQVAYGITDRVELVTSKILTLLEVAPEKLEIEYSIRDNIVWARIQDAGANLEMFIPLPNIAMNASKSRKEKALLEQLTWTNEIAKPMKVQFDFSFQVVDKLSRIKNAALIAKGLKALQSTLKPVDFENRDVPEIQFRDLIDTYSLSLNE